MLEIFETDSPSSAVALAIQMHPLFAREELEARPDTHARATLRHLVDDSGMSLREFARRVLGRDVRSLSRYLGGETIPPELADQIGRMSIEVTEASVIISIQR